MWYLWLQKKVRVVGQQFFPLLFCFFWCIRDPGWIKIRIRDKHPGSATLVLIYEKRKSSLLHQKNIQQINRFCTAGTHLCGARSASLLVIIFTVRHEILWLGVQVPDAIPWDHCGQSGQGPHGGCWPHTRGTRIKLDRLSKIHISFVLLLLLLLLSSLPRSCVDFGGFF